MQEKTRKLIQWICLIAAVLGGVFAVIHATGSSSDHVLNGMQEIGNPMSGMYNIAYFIMVVMMVVAVVAILVFVIRQLIDNFKNDPRKARKALISCGLLIVVVLLSYLFSKSDDVSHVLLEKNGVSEGASKWIGAACIMVYIMVIVAFIAIIYTEIAKAFKKK